MNYPLGANEDPMAPWRIPAPEKCPDCGSDLSEEEDEWSHSIEYRCEQCEYTETISDE